MCASEGVRCVCLSPFHRLLAVRETIIHSAHHSMFRELKWCHCYEQKSCLTPQALHKPIAVFNTHQPMSNRFKSFERNITDVIISYLYERFGLLSIKIIMERDSCRCRRLHPPNQSQIETQKQLEAERKTHRRRAARH